jgi:hypothetical protein
MTEYPQTNGCCRKMLPRFVVWIERELCFSTGFRVNMADERMCSPAETIKELCPSFQSNLSGVSAI